MDQRQDHLSSQKIVKSVILTVFVGLPVAFSKASAEDFGINAPQDSADFRTKDCDVVSGETGRCEFI